MRRAALLMEKFGGWGVRQAWLWSWWAQTWVTKFLVSKKSKRCWKERQQICRVLEAEWNDAVQRSSWRRQIIPQSQFGTFRMRDTTTVYSCRWKVTQTSSLGRKLTLRLGALMPGNYALTQESHTTYPAIESTSRFSTAIPAHLMDILHYCVWAAELIVCTDQKNHKARQTRQDKARQGKTRQDKTRQDKTRQDKTRQDKKNTLLGALQLFSIVPTSQRPNCWWTLSGW